MITKLDPKNFCTGNKDADEDFYYEASYKCFELVNHANGTEYAPDNVQVDVDFESFAGQLIVFKTLEATPADPNFVPAEYRIAWDDLFIY